MLDVNRLRVIDAVARHGSVTAAAKELHYSQPSVTHHLARLEAETGAQLLQRVGRGIRLTQAGHLLADRIDTLLITGCSTSACVRATATDAKTFHLKPIVIREGVQDRSEICHEFTLFDIQARFADVVSVDEAIAYLQKRN